MEMSQKQTISHAFSLWASPQVSRFAKFCLVGGSGVVVDMGVLFLLADPRCLGIGVIASKIIAAETALANNFLWNELWTFRPSGRCVRAPGLAPPIPAFQPDLRRRHRTGRAVAPVVS
jgi:hypothetical protein